MISIFGLLNRELGLSNREIGLSNRETGLSNREKEYYQFIIVLLAKNNNTNKFTSKKISV